MADQGIRIVKYYAWELPFVERISSLRVKELDKVRSATRLWSDQQRSVSLAVGMFLGRFFPLAGLYVRRLVGILGRCYILFGSGGICSDLSVYSSVFPSFFRSVISPLHFGQSIHRPCGRSIRRLLGWSVGWSVGAVGRFALIRLPVRRHPGEATQTAPNDSGTFASLSGRASATLRTLV